MSAVDVVSFAGLAGSKSKWASDTLGACVEDMQEADARNKSRQEKNNARTEKRIGGLTMQCTRARVAKREGRKADPAMSMVMAGEIECSLYPLSLHYLAGLGTPQGLLGSGRCGPTSTTTPPLVASKMSKAAQALHNHPWNPTSPPFKSAAAVRQGSPPQAVPRASN